MIVWFLCYVNVFVVYFTSHYNSKRPFVPNSRKLEDEFYINLHCLITRTRFTFNYGLQTSLESFAIITLSSRLDINIHPNGKLCKFTTLFSVWLDFCVAKKDSLSFYYFFCHLTLRFVNFYSVCVWLFWVYQSHSSIL